MMKRILAGLAGTGFVDSAVRRAVELAAAQGAEVTAVPLLEISAADEEGIPGGAHPETVGPREHLLRTRTARLRSGIEQFQSECERRGVRHRVRAGEGRPLDRLIRQARTHDLTVLALRGILEEGVLDAPEETLLRLLSEGVRPILAVARPYREVRRVMIATHGSFAAASALKRFVQLRLWPDAELHVAAFDLPESEARACVEDACSYCRAHGFQAVPHRFSGPVSKELLPRAGETDSDLIVLGVSPRSLFLRRLLGDTVLSVVREADRPLFLGH